jgi:hypothetical protein
LACSSGLFDPHPEIGIVTTTRQNRRRPSIGAEFLETRNLLNAHVPHAAEVHVAAVHVKADQATPPPAPKPPKAPHVISGTLTGIVTTIVNPNNIIQGYETYAASAPAKSGTATYYGIDSFSGVQVSPSTFNDTYFNGTTVLYLAGGNDVSINYVGKGPYPASNTGPYSASFKGEAIGITGALTGHEYAFKAALTGDATTGAVSIKFTLKD